MLHNDMIIALRASVPHEVFDHPTLLSALTRYRKPRDRISILLAAKEIIRVKHGLYVFAEQYRRKPVSREYLANLTHGPSYVSLESALSFHGLIPERVEAVTSVTTGRSKEFRTPFGVFTYQGLPVKRYCEGIGWEAGGGCPFFIASPEKALVDKVWCDKGFPGRGPGDMGRYLIEELRIEESSLRHLSLDRLRAIATLHASTKIETLFRFLSNLKGGSDA